MFYGLVFNFGRKTYTLNLSYNWLYAINFLQLNKYNVRLANGCIEHQIQSAVRSYTTKPEVLWYS
jgi:hypothetical protein